MNRLKNITIDFREINKEPLNYISHFQKNTNSYLSETEQKDILIQLTNSGLKTNKKEQMRELTLTIQNFVNAIL